MKNGRMPERTIGNICVFCGSGKGVNPAYASAARTLGRNMAKAGIGLVYGGGSLGMMGEVARSVLKHGGSVTGIIPEFLTERERMLKDAQTVIVTKDMHERKRLMFEKSDAFVALPGGIGTLEELVEQMTWSQLGRHEKPIVLGNIHGFWQPLLSLIDHMRTEAYIRKDLEIRLHVVDKASAIVPKIVESIAKTARKPAAEAAIAEKF